MKQNWSNAQDRWEGMGKTVDKTNFLAIYAEAHLKTLISENIRSAFRKTGVIPLNPNVITEAMMAPSLETSIRGTLPIELPSPIKTMAGMIRDYLDYQKSCRHQHRRTQTCLMDKHTTYRKNHPQLHSLFEQLSMN
jgi:hypothetical protein